MGMVGLLAEGWRSKMIRYLSAGLPRDATSIPSHYYRYNFSIRRLHPSYQDTRQAML